MGNFCYDHIIIGAGITGLTTAYKLIQKGKRVVVLEKHGRVGGQIESVEKSGYIYEMGPNTAVLSHPEVALLFEELKSDCKIDIAEKSAKRRLIWKKDRFHPLPSGLISAVTTPLFSFYDKFRILGEPFRAKGVNPNESVGALTCRRLGRSFLEYAVDPFISGIYAGDPMTLTTKYALPKLFNLEQDYGGFIKGTIAKSKIPQSDYQKLATKDVFSAKGGFSKLVDALYKRVGAENIVLNVKNSQIKIDDDGYRVDCFIGDNHNSNNQVNSSSFYAESVITTCGAYELEELLSFVDKKDLEPITKLKYAPVVQVSIGVSSNVKIQPAFGGLVPSCEKRELLGILFPSACFKGRTPDGSELYSIFMGGLKHPEMVDKSDSEIEKIVTKSMSEMLYRDNNAKFEVLAISRHKKAIPQYEATTKERYESIEKIEREYPNLYLAGNIKGGIGMADRIKQGFELAEK